MTRPAAVTPEAVRRHNLGGLLKLLHVHGAASRSDLVALTGLNRSTVRAMTTQLVAAGLVRESTPPGHGSAGRPSIVVEPESQRVFAVAVDIGADHVTAARIGLGGVVLECRRLRQSAGDNDAARMLRRLVAIINSLLADAPADARCVGVGVAVAGVVRSRDGLVRFAPNLGWVDVPLGTSLASRLQTSLPVSVGNDADLGAQSEHLRGAAAGMSDVIYLSGEVGMGGGIILAGRPMTGAGGYAGEIGHMSVNPRGQMCRCGRRGCWETEVGEDAVLRATGAVPGLRLDDVLTAHARGERWTRAGLRHVGQWLGLGIANLVNIFNPEMIVFGGLTRDIYPATECVVREVLDSALPAPRAQVRLELSGLGPDSVLVGAAELALGTLLDDPLDVVSPLSLDA